MNGLPDYLGEKMKILFIGYNPGLRSAELGHHYAGKSNSFFPFLYESGLISEPLTYEDDALLLPDYGYGLTNLVSRPSLGIKDLTREDYREGAKVLREKLSLYQPRIAAYVGIGIYKQFSGRQQIKTGVQKDSIIEGIFDFVLPSTSGLNRMPYTEKKAWFVELKNFLSCMQKNDE
jgi:TDG/mug DNA glycosylase family protein